MKALSAMEQMEQRWLVATAPTFVVNLGKTKPLLACLVTPQDIETRAGT